jgi:hypothetical protein
MKERGLDYFGPEKRLQHNKDKDTSKFFTEGDIVICPQKAVLKLSK